MCISEKKKVSSGTKRQTLIQVRGKRSFTLETESHFSVDCREPGKVELNLFTSVCVNRFQWSISQQGKQLLKPEHWRENGWRCAITPHPILPPLTCHQLNAAGFSPLLKMAGMLSALGCVLLPWKGLSRNRDRPSLLSLIKNCSASQFGDQCFQLRMLTKLRREDSRRIPEAHFKHGLLRPTDLALDLRPCCHSLVLWFREN